MNRRDFIAFAGCAALASPLQTFAQARGKIWRVGILDPACGLTQARPTPTSFQACGSVEGRNLTLTWQYADGNFERLPPLATDLVKQRVDVIVTNGVSVPQAMLLKATRVIE